ncbi:hypothetical protein J7F01_03700 [Streptomyces sp. ISL-22]|uniref:hypothetical protein n=1 Tax=unclassified Streptomyces TaxID=2593676 RepID=UPI001BE9C8BE|nr:MULTISPECIES: hypothetical protein [unclassified Streptomyces]MBT2418694.1 hypothetical protein [Streptomyces sp. ISL-24]MBT2431319.1 hypothetical protein [Streptomyces sp. ISL-22]
MLPGARAVLRRLVELGGTASYDDVQEHFADHPQTPIPKNKIGGTLTSIRAVRRRVGPSDPSSLLELDDRKRIYRIEPALTEGLKRAFDPADARPTCSARNQPLHDQPANQASGLSLTPAPGAPPHAVEPVSPARTRRQHLAHRPGHHPRIVLSQWILINPRKRPALAGESARADAGARAGRLCHGTRQARRNPRRGWPRRS